MRPHLPSLMGLLAFEASARHLSVTRAAKELNLTQSAISHQIRKVERQIGVTLFVRDRNGFKLTDAAQDYLPSVRLAIAELAESTNRIRTNRDDSLLTIKSLASYAIKCLNPMLPDLQKKLPKLRVQILAATKFNEFEERNYDVAIRYGHGKWPGFENEWLFGETIFPVASPRLICQSGLALSTLNSLPIIRTKFLFTQPDDWPTWLEAAGIPNTQFEHEVTFDQPIASLEAAADGVGVALGRSAHVERDIANGRLIVPWEIRAEPPSSYWISIPNEKTSLRKVKQFREWFIDHCGGKPKHSG